MAQTLTREGSDWGEALATLLRGMVAAVRGDRATAASSLADAVRRFDRDGMALFEHVARWRQAEVEDGDAAAELSETARAWMSEQQVVCPERWVAVFAPLPEGDRDQ